MPDVVIPVSTRVIGGVAVVAVMAVRLVRRLIVYAGLMRNASVRLGAHDTSLAMQEACQPGTATRPQSH